MCFVEGISHVSILGRREVDDFSQKNDFRSFKSRVLMNKSIRKITTNTHVYHSRKLEPEYA